MSQPDPQVLLTDLGSGMRGVTVYGEPSNRSSELSTEELDACLLAGVDDDEGSDSGDDSGDSNV